MVNQAIRYSFDHRKINNESKSSSETKRDFKLFKLFIKNRVLNYLFFYLKLCFGNSELLF